MDIFEKHRKELESIAVGVALGDLVDVNVQSALAEISTNKPIYVIGAGKGVVHMARQVEDLFGDHITDGIIISNQRDYSLENIQVFNGFHPIPNSDSVASSFEILDLISSMPANAQVIALFTGGASSLFCIPPKGIEIHDLQDAYHLLLNSGASIHEMNVVRKHLSTIKGGRLARYLKEHKTVSILLSDVPGDHASTIASGPTVPDESTFGEAKFILKEYDVWEDLPASIKVYLNEGCRGEKTETLKEDEYSEFPHSCHIISGEESLLYNVRDFFNEAGYQTYIDDEAFDDTVSGVSKMVCSKTINVLSNDQPVSKPAALIFNGESTVQVNKEGKGGRNQHLALIAALSLEGQHSVSMLCLGTDGIDGNTTAAGAIINSMTTLQARKQKLEPESYLQNFNSYHFHKKMGTQVITGKTGTNMMDLIIVLVEKPVPKE